MQELFSNLGIDAKLLLIQAINFLIIFWLLSKFVFPKVIRFIEQRKERIQEGLDLTEKAKREMDRINQARQREIESAKREADSLLNQGRALAQEKERQALSLAKEKVEGMLSQAKKDAERAKEEAVRNARGEIGKAALLLAERVLSRNITKEDQERMAKEVLEELDKQYAR